MRLIVSSIMVALILSTVFFGVSYYKIKKNSTNVLVNTTLYDVALVVDLKEYVEKKQIDDKFLNEKIEFSLLSAIATMSTSEVSISNLRGIPFNTLYRIVLLRKNGKFHRLGEDPRFRTYFKYLDSIEKEVLELFEAERALKRGQLGNIKAKLQSR